MCDDFIRRLSEVKCSLMNHRYLLYQNLVQIKNSMFLFLPSIFKAEQVCLEHGVSFLSELVALISAGTLSAI